MEAAIPMIIEPSFTFSTWLNFPLPSLSRRQSSENAHNWSTFRRIWTCLISTHFQNCLDFPPYLSSVFWDLNFPFRVIRPVPLIHWSYSEEFPASYSSSFQHLMPFFLTDLSEDWTDFAHNESIPYVDVNGFLLKALDEFEVSARLFEKLRY